jgi:hypothetical protein
MVINIMSAILSFDQRDGKLPFGKRFESKADVTGVA